MRVIDKVRIEDIVVEGRFRKDLGNLEPLAMSIAEVGQLQPIGITADKKLVFGERRLAACRDKLQLVSIDAVTVDLKSVLQGEHDENALRKDFTQSERVAIGKALEQELGQRRGGANPEKFPDCKGKETRNLAATAAGFGNAKTYQQAKAVVETAAPEVVEAMDKGDISINKAHEISKLDPEVQNDLDKALAEVERLKVEKREQAQKSAALEKQVSELRENQGAMRIAARDEARKASEAEVKKLNDELAKVRAEIEFRVKEEGRLAAEAEMATHKDDVAKARKAERDARQAIERLNANADRIRNHIKEMEQQRKRFESVDYECKMILDDADVILDKMTALMITLSDLDHVEDHPDKVKRRIHSLADQSEKLSIVLKAVYQTKLVVIEGGQ